MNQAGTTPRRRCGPRGKRAWAWRTVLAGAACAAAFEAAVRWTPFPADALTRYTPSVVLTDRGGEPLRVRLA
ncbi:MAG TPA: hypothetical protein PKM43_00425, partial [Verrucomicrobiota bacterium]|nr:hypothetical protein [Verrucomicrobiota bacterium]